MSDDAPLHPPSGGDTFDQKIFVMKNHLDVDRPAPFSSNELRNTEEKPDFTTGSGSLLGG
jgi:hypothetical protein